MFTILTFLVPPCIHLGSYWPVPVRTSLYCLVPGVQDSRPDDQLQVQVEYEKLHTCYMTPKTLEVLHVMACNLNVITCNYMHYKPLHAIEDANDRRLRYRHLESCTPGTRQYKLVCTGTRQYILFWIQGGPRKVKNVHTSTDWYVPPCTDLTYFYGSTYWYVGMYFPVQGGTRTKYKEVHGGTRNSTRRY